MGNVSRFLSALKARVTASDRHLVEEYLSEAERALFYRQTLADQRHALDVARFVLSDAPDRAPAPPLCRLAGAEADPAVLVKAALLHDVGKSLLALPLWVRPVAVVLRSVAPRAYARLAGRGEAESASRLWRRLYVYKFHPVLGGRMLAAAGSDGDVVNLVRRHHRRPVPGEPPLLTALRRGDKRG